MLFEFDNTTPIYLQLVEQIKIDIISGKFASGERLPSVRDLALKTKVNPNTMQKALSELEEMGLIFTERTNGKFVTHDTSLIEKFKIGYAHELSCKFLLNMKNAGFSEKDALQYLEELGGKL